MASPSVTKVTRRDAANYPTAIQQRITAGGNFDGTLPQLSAVRADSPLSQGNAQYKYASSTRGGLFFWDSVETLICTQIHVGLGASANVIVSICNLDQAHINDDAPVTLAGEDIIIAQATAVTFLNLGEAQLKATLLPYQAIKIVSTASAAAQIARVYACLERTLVR